MDPEIIALASSGAGTIVGLAATDAWNGMKTVFSRFAKRPKAAVLAEIIEEVELERSVLSLLPEGARERARGQQLSSVREKLSSALSDNPDLEPILRDFVDAVAAEQSLISGRVEFRGTAYDGGKVYQQGSGIQFNG